MWDGPDCVWEEIMSICMDLDDYYGWDLDGHRLDNGMV
jgi:hypothetical protein